MQTQEKATLAEYRGGRTLDIAPTSGAISKSECQKLLRIKSDRTLASYLKLMELKRDYLSWEDIREILSLQAFLSLKPGEHSKEMYRFLRDRNSIQQIFQEFDVDITSKLERLKNDYQRTTEDKK